MKTWSLYNNAFSTFSCCNTAKFQCLHCSHSFLSRNRSEHWASRIHSKCIASNFHAWNLHFLCNIDIPTCVYTSKPPASNFRKLRCAACCVLLSLEKFLLTYGYCKLEHFNLMNIVGKIDCRVASKCSKSS